MLDLTSIMMYLNILLLSLSLFFHRFRSRLTDSFGVNQFQKPVLYSGRGRPPKRAFLNAGGMNEVIFKM